MHIYFWSENLNGKDHLGDLGIYGKIIIKWILRKYGVRVWTGFMWLSGSFLRIWY
jgi:hypothetical protein